MNTDLNNLQARFKKVLVAAPRLLGNHAVNYFLDSWKRQAWLGTRLQPWAKRRSNKRRPGRAILVDSGRLRRSIRITNITGPQVTIGTDVPYAKAHNEGFKGTVQVRAHSRVSKRTVVTRYLKDGTASKAKSARIKIRGADHRVKAHNRKVNIVQRQFMGSSPYLTTQLKRILQAELNRAMR